MGANQSAAQNLQAGSDTVCKVRALFYVPGVIIMIVISVILVYVGFSRPYHESVNVTVDESQSSHELVSYNVDSVQTDEEVVVGTHVAGSSTTNCRMKKTRRKHSTGFSEKCDCSGYSYLYNNQTARCAGHPGKCRTQPTHDLIRNISTNELRCKTGPINCTIAITPTTSTTPTTPSPSLAPSPEVELSAPISSTVTCPYDKNCPNVGEVAQFPVDLTTQVVSCLTENWNKCDMRFNHNGGTHSHSKAHNGICEDLVNTTLALFLTADGNYVQDQDHTRTITWSIAAVLGVITLISMFNIYFMLTNSVYCGVSNVMAAAGAVSRTYDRSYDTSYSYNQ
tara:strand:- start:8743 stop:9756 length:1014 start_codon:yes stop_codon:yes gene_type:complete